MRGCFASMLVAAAVVMAPAAQAAGVLERAAERGGLVAAANPDELPLAARDESGDLVGFDIEVAEEIARRLDLPLTFVTPGWDAILAGDWDGAWDYSVSNITPTEARSRVLDFPAVYRLEAVVAVVPAGDRRTNVPTTLSGKRIGVAQNTTFEQYLKGNLELFEGARDFEYVIQDPDIRPFPSKDAAMAALAMGDGAEIDAVVTNLSTAKAAIDGGAPLRIVPGFLYWEPIAVAVDKGDPAFAARIDAAVQGMMADGTLSALSKKWFGLDLTTPTLQ